MTEILDKCREYEETYHVVGRAHYLAADRYNALNRIFGIPVIIITAVIGTTIFGTLDKNPNPNWKIGAGLFALAGTVLSALQTSLGFAQTAQKHKAAGEAYRTMRRRFEMFHLRYSQAGSDQRQVAMDALEKIVAELANLPKEFPTIPEGCYARSEKEAKKRTSAGSIQTQQPAAGS
jgi:hypothetical protein